MPPLVTVVIPTYNQAHFLKEALSSVKAQTYAHWEAIIINNHSQDDTILVVEGFNDTRIKLLNFKNHGIIAASRNQGIKQADGEFVAFLDSDDLWEPDKIDKCVKLLMEGYDVVCHDVIERWDDGRFQKTLCRPKKGALYEQLLYGGNCFVTSATVVRRSILIKADGFNENPEFITAEDYDLWLRIARLTRCIGYIPLQLGVNRIHGNNASNSNLQYFKAEHAVISSHFKKERNNNRLKLKKMRERYASAFYNTARKYQEIGCLKEATRYLVRSMINNPFCIQPYISSTLLIIRYLFRLKHC